MEQKKKTNYVWYIDIEFDVGGKTYKYYSYDQLIVDIYMGDLQYYCAMAKYISITRVNEDE